jgi:hypothetical protein
MLERDYKMQALSLATQLPDDEATARKVYALLGELMDQWIFNDRDGQTSLLPNKPSGMILSAETKCMGNAEELPR